MPAERTLPIAAEHREFTVKVDGEAVPREHALQALSVTAAANRIATARLTYVDGAAGQGDFPLSNKPLFAPGAAVEISAGAGSSPALVFKGIVTGIRLKVREASPSTLIVECRHAASRLTLVRRSANFFDQSDGDAIESLLGAAGVSGAVDATSVNHKQLVQHDCSDWDFINARAAANGLLVFTRAADLALRKPELASAKADLRFGATLLEIDAEVDGRAQPAAVQVLTWSAADQALTTTDGTAPAFKTPGNFDPDSLASGAGPAALLLRHAALDEAEANALAAATWQTARLDWPAAASNVPALPPSCLATPSSSAASVSASAETCSSPACATSSTPPVAGRPICNLAAARPTPPCASVCKSTAPPPCWPRWRGCKPGW
ncbi:phage late control D family protein [Roseateles sp. GG27B]